MNDRAPVIIGVGQVVQRPGSERPREPLALMADAARRAEADAGIAGVLSEIDSIRVVNILSWPSKAPAQDLARALAVAPREALYTHVGGNVPQWLVNETAEAIATGEVRLALIAGAESMNSARRARAAGVDLGWSPRGTPVPDMGDGRPGTSEIEARHGAMLPTNIYPLFENAYRAHLGRGLDEHRAALGALMTRLSAAASRNACAWFPEEKSAAQIATPSKDNRYVGFPYTKYMNAIMEVDQGAALLVTSAGEARRLGVAEEKLVYLHGCGDVNDHWFITERVNYWSSPAMRASGARALSMAGLGIGDIALFDLYSCFPIAVEFACDALGIAHDDPRPLSVAGGLPYFGGPGNNYVTHSIAAMVGRLRAERGSFGMVTGNGWYLTKQSTGIYSTAAPARAFERSDPKTDQARIDAEPHPPLAAAPSGAGEVEAYTIVYDRECVPERATIIGRTPAGERFIANTPAERRLLEAMAKREMVGARGSVSQADDGRNIFTPEI